MQQVTIAFLCEPDCFSVRTTFANTHSLLMLVKSESNFSILFGLFLSEQTAGTIGTLGGIQDVLAAMRAFPNDAEICANACSALSCLTIHGKDQQTDWQTDKSTQDSGRTRLNPRLYIYPFLN